VENLRRPDPRLITVSDRQARIAIGLFIAAVAFIMIVAFYGYINDKWHY
jgi:hypothetical protein